MIKVHGFPRSGNHLLMEMLSVFYTGDLSTPPGYIGHWADRVYVKSRSPFGKLAGHHFFPQWGYDRPAVYIFRDIRAVAASLWRSPHFKHPMWRGRAFSDFIRAPVDWCGSVGWQGKTRENLVQHWQRHIEEWRKEPVTLVRYESLLTEPDMQMKRIATYEELQRPYRDYVLPENLVGWFPSGGVMTGWRKIWSAEDLEWLAGQVPADFLGLWRGYEES